MTLEKPEKVFVTWPHDDHGVRGGGRQDVDHFGGSFTPRAERASPTMARCTPNSQPTTFGMHTTSVTLNPHVSARVPVDDGVDAPVQAPRHVGFSDKVRQSKCHQTSVHSSLPGSACARAVCHENVTRPAHPPPRVAMKRSERKVSQVWTRQPQPKPR